MRRHSGDVCCRSLPSTRRETRRLNLKLVTNRAGRDAKSVRNFGNRIEQSHWLGPENGARSCKAAALALWREFRQKRTPSVEAAQGGRDDGCGHHNAEHFAGHDPSRSSDIQPTVACERLAIHLMLSSTGGRRHAWPRGRVLGSLMHDQGNAAIRIPRLRPAGISTAAVIANLAYPQK